MKNILVLTYWSYKNALIQTYTLPYVRIIKKNLPTNSRIFLLTIEQAYFKISDDDWEKECNQLKTEGIHLIRIQYDHFGLKMILRLLKWVFTLKKLIQKEKIESLHAWCTPAGALGYILSKLTSKPLVLDSYEPHAEAMVENGSWKKSSLKFKLLFWLEKKQSKRAKTAIALTQGMRDYAREKYNASFDEYYVKPALVNLDKFKWSIAEYESLRDALNLKDKVVCLYAGKLGGIYLEKELFDFLAVAYKKWKDQLKVYLLTDANIDLIKNYLHQNGIPEDTVVTKFVPYHEIPNYFKLADFAINPVKPVPSKRYCTSIKDGEYWAAGLPVVITKDISDDSTLIDATGTGYVLNELSTEEYHNACEKIHELLEQGRGSINTKVVALAEQYRSYAIAEDIYKKVYI